MLYNILKNLKERYAAWRAWRQAAEELWGLDDRSLADIGISRSDIPRLLSKYQPEEIRRPEAPAGRLRHA